MGEHERPNECPICLGTGDAIVPHLENVKDGAWVKPFATCVVFCVCSLGQTKFNALTDVISEARSKNKKTWPDPLPWAKYEALVPNWWQLLKWREEELKKPRPKQQQKENAHG